jgi:all-trans-8'-apo-beta-carotenal 15,15'-oxygenase
LSQVHDGNAGTSFLAVFEAANVAAGPVARVRLRHAVPISFHGYWNAA